MTAKDSVAASVTSNDVPSSLSVRASVARLDTKGRPMAEHTPGPWQCGRSRFALNGSTNFVCDRIGRSVAHVQDRDSNDECAANARLIAAAPTMLAALHRAALALAFASESSAAMLDDYKAVSAAIAEAVQS